MSRSSIPAWKWEIAALLTSFSSAVVIAVLLFINNNKPVWSQNNVTLNAVISVLATISKTTLMFAIGEAVGQWKWLLFSRHPRPLIDMERIDSASRGPLGSARLLWHVNSFSLLPLGGLLIVLALAMDPFTQQLVQTDLRFQNTTEDAPTISRAQRYSKGSVSFVSTYAAGPSRVSATIDFAMESAILYGLASPYGTVSQQTTFNCPSGNCTWDPFESLAVCSVCNRLDDQVTSYDAMNWLYVALEGDPGTGAEYFPNGTTFQLPNGLFINNGNGPLRPSYARAVLMTTYGSTDASKTHTLKSIDTLIWAMTILKIPSPTSGLTWPSSPLEASECGLYYCVKQYRAEVRRGVLNETESQVDASRNPQSWQPTSGNLSQTTQDGLEFSNATSTINRTDLMLGDQFNVSRAAVHGISAYFQQTFKSTSDLPSNITQRQNELISNDTDLVTLNGWVLDEASFPPLSDQTFSPRALQAFYSTTDMNKIFETLAKSVTNAMRSGSDENVSLPGTSHIVTNFYRIVWPWLALHTFLIITGIGFFIVTASQTRFQDVPIWKSHSLAPLSRYAEIGDVLDGTESIEKMESKASQYLVSLFPKR